MVALADRCARIVKRVREYDFVPQFPVTVGSKTYRLDFGFPAQMVGVEGHSIRWHMGEDFHRADVKRDRHLSLLGWTVLYFDAIGPSSGQISLDGVRTRGG